MDGTGRSTWEAEVSIRRLKNPLDRDLRALERAVQADPYDDVARERYLNAKARTGDEIALRAVAMIRNGMSALLAHRTAMGVVATLSFEAEDRIAKSYREDPESFAGRVVQRAKEKLSPPFGHKTEESRAVESSFNGRFFDYELGALAWRPLGLVRGRMSEEAMFLRSLDLAVQRSRVALHDAWVELGGKVRLRGRPRTNPPRTCNPLDADLRTLERAVQADPSDEDALVAYLTAKRRLAGNTEAGREIDRILPLLTTQRRAARRAAQVAYQEYLDIASGRAFSHEDGDDSYTPAFVMRGVVDMLARADGASWPEIVMDDAWRDTIRMHMAVRSDRRRMTQLARQAMRSRRKSGLTGEI